MKRRKRGRVSPKEEEQELVGRELLIMETIREHPDWHYSRLKEHFANGGIMQGQTFHRTQQKMIEEGKIASIRREKKKFYYEMVTGSTLDKEEFRKAMNYITALFEKLVTNIASKYQKMSRLDKATNATNLIDELFRKLNGLTVRLLLGINTITQCEEYEVRLRGMVAKVLEMVRNDKDSGAVLPFIMMRVTPALPTSEDQIRSQVDRL